MGGKKVCIPCRLVLPVETPNALGSACGGVPPGCGPWMPWRCIGFAARPFIKCQFVCVLTGLAGTHWGVLWGGHKTDPKMPEILASSRVPSPVFQWLPPLVRYSLRPTCLGIVNKQ